MKKEIAIIVKYIEAIPPLPMVARQIMELLQDEATPMSKIAELVERDIALASRLMTLANSPFYGTLSRVSSIDHALVLLGLNEVRAALMALSVYNFFSDREKSAEYKRNLWRHAIVCSQTAKMLANRFRQPGADAIFLAALLHDVGKVALESFVPGLFQQVTAAVKKEGIPFSKAERAIIGASHYQVAAKLLQQWQFPGSIVLPVFYHHAPWHAREFGNESAVVYLANILTHMAGYATMPEEPVMEPQQFADSEQCQFLVRSGFDLDGPLVARLVEQTRITLADNPQLFSFLEGNE